MDHESANLLSQIAVVVVVTIAIGATLSYWMYRGASRYEAAHPELFVRRRALPAERQPRRERAGTSVQELKTGAKVVALLLIFGAVVYVAATLSVSIDGPRNCETAFRSAHSSLAESSVTVQRMWTRTGAHHWVSAVVLQPYDLAQPPTTVVCHFPGYYYSSKPRIELFAGDKVVVLKAMTLSNADPRLWFE